MKMYRNQIELVEYEPKDVELSRNQIQELLDAAPFISVTPSNLGENYYQLRPDSRVGVINLPKLQILIKPKIPISSTFLLSINLLILSKNLSLIGQLSC